MISLYDLGDYSRSRCVWIDADGGTGKTYIYTTLCYFFFRVFGNIEDVSKQPVVITVTSSGIAATLLPVDAQRTPSFAFPSRTLIPCPARSRKTPTAQRCSAAGRQSS